MQKFLLVPCLFFVVASLAAQANVQIISDFDDIQSVKVTNYTQTENLEKPYEKTLHFDLSQSKVNLYSIYFIDKAGTRKRLQVWLDPNPNMKIWVTQKEGYLEISRVENIPTHLLREEASSVVFRLKKADKVDSLNLVLLHLISQNPGNTFCTRLASTYIQQNLSDTVALRALEKLMLLPENNFDWFPMHTPMMNNLQGMLYPKPLILDSYPLVGLDSSAQKITLKKGALTVLDFWFLNCPPCRKDHINIKTDIAQFEQKDIQLIGMYVTSHSDLPNLNTYLEEHGYTWRNYLQSSEKTITEELSINMYPTYLVLDDQGNILYRSHQYDEVKTFLKFQ